MINSDNDHSDEDDNGGSESSSEENENDYIDSGDRDESRDIIFAFIDNEEVERPATTCSGRSITKRSEIDFSCF